MPLCLPSIVESAKKSSYPTTVTVLNNPGTPGKDGIDYVKTNFPEVSLKQSPKNRILCSYNDYLPEVSEPIVILLNNDIRVEGDFVDALVKKFEEDEKTFMVAPRVLNFDGTALDAGPSRAGIRFGMFWCDARYEGYEKDTLTPSETYSSGFAAFSKEKFMELGGYDDRFLPGIMEDVDICFRAAKKGYKLYYEPTSVVYHVGQASFKKTFGKSRMSAIAHRNNFLFMWKNLSSFFDFDINSIFFLCLCG